MLGCVIYRYSRFIILSNRRLLNLYLLIFLLCLGQQQSLADDNPEGQALLKTMHNMKIKSFVSYNKSMEEMTKGLIKAGHL